MDKSFLNYSENFPKILNELNCSLAFSAYQAGKLIFASSRDGKNLTLFAKTFKRPMGIAVDRGRLAVASKFEVDLFNNAPKLARTFPDKRKDYDALYLPQLTYHTGYSDIHEIGWSSEGLWTVNTAFSCLSLMDERYNFIPKWKPWFISELVPEDRCHMNGFALDAEGPAYVSIYNNTNVRDGWRTGAFDSGLIVDTRKQKILCDGLAMPHSPRLSGQNLLFLQSATGQIMQVDTGNGKCHEIARLNGFLRGLAQHENYLFVGRSEKRESAKTFKELPIYKQPCVAGISILDISSGKEIAQLNFTGRIKEIFSVDILESTNSPCIFGANDTQKNNCIHASDNINYWLRL